MGSLFSSSRVTAACVCVCSLGGCTRTLVQLGRLSPSLFHALTRPSLPCALSLSLLQLVLLCLSKQCNKIQLFPCASCTLFRLLSASRMCLCVSAARISRISPQNAKSKKYRQQGSAFFVLFWGQHSNSVKTNNKLPPAPPTRYHSHIQTHSREHPYQCNSCSCTFLTCTLGQLIMSGSGRSTKSNIISSELFGINCANS